MAPVKIAEAFIGLSPRFNPGFDNQVSSQARQAGNKAGAAMGKELAVAGDKAGADSGSRAGKAFHSTFKRVAQLAALGAGIAGALVGRQLVDSIGKASDLNETISKSNNIFGKNAKVVEAWSKTSATSLGLSQSAALESAASLGNMFQQLGFAGKKATTMSTSVVKLAADLGSFNNLGTDDVLSRIQAGFRGEYDSLQQLIPNINAARVEQEALSMTHKKSAKNLTAAEKATATLAIIQKDGAAAANDFAETSGGLANQQKILAAQVANAKTKIGQALLPTMVSLVTLLNTSVIPAGAKLVDQYGPRISEMLASVGPKISGFISTLSKGPSSGTSDSLSSLGDSFSKLGPVLSSFMDQVPKLSNVLSVSAAVFGFFAEHVDLLVKLLPLLVLGYVAVKISQIAANAAALINIPVRIAEVAATRAHTAAMRSNAVAIGSNAAVTGTATAVETTSTAAKNAGIFATIRSRVAMVASAVATKAVAAATAVWTGIQWALNAAMSANPIGIIIVVIIALVAAIVLAYKNSKTFRDVVQKVWAGIKVAVVAAWGVIQPILINIWTALKFLGGVFVWLYQHVVLPIWTGIRFVMVAAWPAIQIVFGLFQIWLKIVGWWFGWLYNNVVKPIWAGISAVIGVAWSVIKIVFASIQFWVKILAGTFTWLWQNVLSPVWAGISFVIGRAWIGAKVLFGFFMAGVRVLGGWFRWLKSSVIDPVWNGIRNTISLVWNRGILPVFNAVKNVITVVIPNAFRTGVTAIKNAWDKIKDVAKIPVRFVIETVLNKGIIAGYNKIAGVFGVSPVKGIALPKGFKHGGPVGSGVGSQDDQLIMARRGEHVFTPEEVRAAGGHRAIEAYRRRLRARRAGGPLDDFTRGFGVIKDSVLGGDPLAVVRQTGNTLLNRIPGGGSFQGLVKGFGSKVLGGLIGWVKSKLAVGGGPANLGSNSSGSVGDILGVARHFLPQATVSSGFRPGDPGYHGQGLAADLIGGGAGGMAAMARGFYNMSGKLLELIHSGGGGFFVKNGRRVPASYYASEIAGHYNHVHVAARRDALPRFDQGGWLTGVGVNTSGKPEAVLTGAESAGLKRMGTGVLSDKLDDVVKAVQGLQSQGGAGRSVSLSIHGDVNDPVDVDMIMNRLAGAGRRL